MDNLGSKIPTINGLGKKLDMMNELHPELKSLVKDITAITDMRDMEEAKVGGQAIKKVLDLEGKAVEREWVKKIDPDLQEEAKLTKAAKASEDEAESEPVASKKAAAPAEIDTPKKTKKAEKEDSDEKEEKEEKKADKGKKAADAAALAIKKAGEKAAEVSKKSPEAAKAMLKVAKTAAVAAAKEVYS